MIPLFIRHLKRERRKQPKVGLSVTLVFFNPRDRHSHSMTGNHKGKKLRLVLTFFNIKRVVMVASSSNLP